MENQTIAHGTCLCGAVSISATDMSKSLCACHCTMCIKWGGGPWLAVECVDVTFTGQEHIKIYDSSAWAERGFCQRCGNHLFYRIKRNNLYYISIGLFDECENVKFDLQMFIDQKPEYYCFANETEELTAAEVYEKYAAPPTSS